MIPFAGKRLRPAKVARAKEAQERARTRRARKRKDPDRSVKKRVMGKSGAKM
jgi:hypothetical protein